MVAKKYQNPSGGLNAAGRRYFKSKGHNLKRPVTGKVKEEVLLQRDVNLSVHA